MDQTISFALPGTAQRVELPWNPDVHTAALTLDGILAALPRSWAGREITAGLPGLATPVVLRAFTTDVEALVQVFIRRDYEISVPREPRFIIDGGANIGLTSLYFARKYPGASILAVEAERSNHELLEKNVQGYPRVTARHAAIWERSATLNVYGPRESHPARGVNRWGFMVADGSEAAFTNPVRELAVKIGEVAGVSIGALLDASGFSHIDLLKLDIEGSEREVFSSRECHGWLSRVRTIMIELHDAQKEGCGKAFYAAIEPYEYRESKKGDVTIVELDSR